MWEPTAQQAVVDVKFKSPAEVAAELADLRRGKVDNHRWVWHGFAAGYGNNLLWVWVLPSTSFWLSLSTWLEKGGRGGFCVGGGV